MKLAIERLFLICNMLILALLVSCKSETGNNAEKLLSDYKNNNSSDFVKDFPCNDTTFKVLFDFDGDKEGIFYNESGQGMIDFFFSQSPAESNRLTIEKSIKICSGLEKWDADLINYFQHMTKQYVLLYPQDYLEGLEKTTADSQKRFWHFLLSSAFEEENEDTRKNYLQFYEVFSVLSAEQGALIKEEYSKVYNN